MPRGVRKAKASSRPKPKLPEGDEGKDMTPDDRRRKLELFLKDFDNTVKEKVQDMRSDAQKIISSINAQYSMAFMKLPEAVWDMTVEEFMRTGGVINKDSFEDADSVIDEMVDGISLKARSTVKKDTRSRKAATERKTVKKGRRPKGRNQMVTVPGAENMPPPPPTTGRTRRAMAVKQEMCTPANFSSHGPGGFETPMVTPKFDPRLVQTVARNARPGETVMSMHGSPIRVTSDDQALREVQVPIGSGKVLTLPTQVDLENVTMPELDDDAVSHIRTLQNMLKTMIEYHQKDT